jgi:hypothetical protein
LRLIGIIGLLLLLLGVVVRPTTTLGAIAISIATSLIASVVVAAFALEREAFAQAILDLGVERLFGDRKRDFGDDFWTNLVRTCRNHYRVLGTANHGYWHDEQTRQDTTRTLTDAIVKRSVDVEFLFLKPDGDLCKRRGQEEQRDTMKDTLVSIDRFWTLREELPEAHRSRLVLKEYDVTPSCGITWVDDTMLVTHYLAGRNNLGSPGLLLRSGGPSMDTLVRPVGGEEAVAPLTDVYVRNFKEIASNEKSTVLTEQRVSELRLLLERMTGPSVSEADLRKQGGE